ncbi:unnamed protein product [Pseudo-nitzschia multistriata]|uniref:Mannosylglycerate hydrolase MGH1-like glycoside hydrolase domain-containing protein n=1 Tax=Pseudo-nitzschia multistriata TaxID=183589 RepID=A0A448Z3Y6_9STRA|nr:unnamed protein product [Pseudo-nitzschia multistriata]
MQLARIHKISKKNVERENIQGDSIPNSSPIDTLQEGLTYKLYDNAALAGNPPRYEGITSLARISLQEPPLPIPETKHSGRFEPNTVLLSGELIGSVMVVNGTKQTSGENDWQDNDKKDEWWVIFRCVFRSTSTGWVKIDGHLVCHDGHAFTQELANDPIRLREGKRYPFRAQITSNDTTSTARSEAPSLEVQWGKADSKRSFLESPGFRSLSTTTRTTTDLKHDQFYSGKNQTNTEQQQQQTSNQNHGVWWHLNPSLSAPEQRRDDLQRSLQTGWGYWLRRDVMSLVKLPEGILLDWKICWQQHYGEDKDTDDDTVSRRQPHRRHCLKSAVPDSTGILRMDRHAYDRSYASYNITFSPEVVKDENDGTSRSRITLKVESSASGKNQEELRVLMTVVDYKIPVHNNNGEGEEFVVELTPGYAWFRPGTVAAELNDQGSQSGFSFSSPGLGVVKARLLWEFDDKPVTSDPFTSLRQRQTAKTTHTKSDSSDVSLRDSSSPEEAASLVDGLKITITGNGQKIAIVAGLDVNKERPDEEKRLHSNAPSSKSQTIREVENFLSTMECKERDRIQQRYNHSREVTEVATVIQAAVMWSLIYNPIENGPFLPVSRSDNWASFGDRAGAMTPDWTYVIFEWDNLFASLLAGLEHKEIAYSNLFQVVKSKTPNGFVPNWSTAGGILQSNDRTEPPVGAKILLELFRKYNETWIVEALWDDLLDWNDWFMMHRRLDPFGLIALGSYYKASLHPNDFVTYRDGERNDKQAARYESGLDNSPMYDSDTYDNATHMMQMYDVGMSALVANEAYCLAELADIIGKTQEVGNRLRKRGDEIQDAILRHLWDPERKIFANRYQLPNNSSFVHPITPTSFYPFLLPKTKHNTGSAVQIDVEEVINNWLLNPKRFCISRNGDFAENDPDVCYWGLPSVSADDPTYMVSGHWNYWRGLSWGPMSQLVYWSLKGQSSASEETESISSNNVIARARRSLCDQMRALLTNQWRANRHICENYSPYKGASDCTGSFYYHWGALNGLIGVVEAGFY